MTGASSYTWPSPSGWSPPSPNEFWERRHCVEGGLLFHWCYWQPHMMRGQYTLKDCHLSHTETGHWDRTGVIVIRHTFEYKGAVNIDLCIWRIGYYRKKPRKNPFRVEIGVKVGLFRPITHDCNPQMYPIGKQDRETSYTRHLHYLLWRKLVWHLGDYREATQDPTGLYPWNHFMCTLFKSQDW